MHTINPHLAVATVLTAGHLGSVRPSAATLAGARAAGGMTLAAVLLVVAFLAAIGSAGRALAALVSEFLRAAAAMASVFFTMVIAVLVAVVLLVHH